MLKFYVILAGRKYIFTEFYDVYQKQQQNSTISHDICPKFFPDFLFLGDAPLFRSVHSVCMF